MAAVFVARLCSYAGSIRQRAVIVSSTDARRRADATATEPSGRAGAVAVLVGLAASIAAPAIAPTVMPTGYSWVSLTRKPIVYGSRSASRDSCAPRGLDTCSMRPGQPAGAGGTCHLLAAGWATSRGRPTRAALGVMSLQAAGGAFGTFVGR
jgi:hypothetical protein